MKFNFIDGLSDEFMEASKDWPQSQIGTDAVIYRFSRAADVPLNSVWLFQFYNAHWALVELSQVDEPDEALHQDS